MNVQENNIVSEAEHLSNNKPQIKNMDAIKKCVENYLKITCPKVVFVYTSPKVGSTALVSTFRIFASKTINVFHYHGENLLPKEYKEQNVTINDLINYCATVLNKKVYVIDVYRTPIEKKMSTYFDRLAVYHFNTPDNVLNTSSSLSVITKRFNQVFPHIGTKDYFFDSYDKSIVKLAPEIFPHTYRVLSVDFNMVKYIKLRLMDSKHWGCILSSIFGLHMEVVTDYACKNKYLGALYDRFKCEYRVPQEYLNNIQENDSQLKYYLSIEEQNAYFLKWNKKVNLNLFADPNAKNDTMAFTKEEFAFYSQICFENSYMDYVQKNVDHYLDEGCLCDACMVKRVKLSKAILANPSSTKPLDPVHHTVAVQQHLANRVVAVATAKNRLRRSGRRRGKSRSRSYSVQMKLF